MVVVVRPGGGILCTDRGLSGLNLMPTGEEPGLFNQLCQIWAQGEKLSVIKSNLKKLSQIPIQSFLQDFLLLFVWCFVCLFVLGVSGVIELPLTEMRRLFIEKKFGG